MMFVVGACSTSNNDDTSKDDTTKKEFISQVADKNITLGFFYDDGTGDFEDYEYGTFTIYEVIDSNTAIYKAEEKEEGKDYYIYLKFEIKDGKIYASSDYNCTTAEQAKESTTEDVSDEEE